MRSKVLWCWLVLALTASAAVASDGNLTWAFQPTGFRNDGSQTAVAMRDGRTWPVIFSNDASSLQAYSLYPTVNPEWPNTYWHQIGKNVFTMLENSGLLSAASSPDGRVGAVLRDAFSSPFGNPPSGAAAVFSSATGFSLMIPNVSAIDFDSHGSLVAGNSGSIFWIPNGPSPGQLVDLAIAPSGAASFLDDASHYYLHDPVIGWQYADLWETTEWRGLGTSPDMAVDSLGRPHIVGGDSNVLMACDFDIIHGRWQSRILASESYVSLASVAADSKGGVGAAWIQDDGYGAELMYAYKNGADDWMLHPVVRSVWNPGTYAYDPVSWQQKVGLAFDANDFPVISFLAGPQEIWLAYDPVGVPEPSTLLLLATAAATMLAVGKARFAGHKPA